MTCDVYLVRVESGIADLLAGSVSPDTVVRAVDAPEEALTAPQDRPVVLVFGTGVDDPVSLAQRACVAYPYCSILVLAEPERHVALARAVQFSPFLSSAVVCLPTGDAARIESTFQRLARQAAQQRTYAAMTASAQAQMGQPAAANMSMRYLDRLLDHAPVGVIVVDAQGAVRAWNRRASIIFGRGEREAVGERFESFFPRPRRARLRRLLGGHAATDTGAAIEGAEALPVTLERQGVTRKAQFVEITATSFADAREGTMTMVIVLDVTERVEAEQEARRLGERAAVAEALARQADALRHLNTQLEQRNRELQDFAYVASHDLQEPLRKISTFSDLVAADYHEVLDDEGRYLLGRMQDAATRMAQLLRALLTYSRVTSRGRSFERLDLNVIAAQVTSDLELSIKESGGSIDVGDLPSVEADPVQMRQLLQNLVSNAIKFHREGVAPVVAIRGRVEDGEGVLAGQEVCRLEVRDQGIGFDEKYLDRIFSPFQRLNSRERYAGMGMGLAICRRIVERHGGTIEAHSRPDAGSTFVVTLPTRHPPASTDAAG